MMITGVIREWDRSCHVPLLSLGTIRSHSHSRYVADRVALRSRLRRVLTKEETRRRESEKLLTQDQDCTFLPLTSTLLPSLPRSRSVAEVERWEGRVSIINKRDGKWVRSWKPRDRKWWWLIPVTWRDTVCTRDSLSYHFLFLTACHPSSHGVSPGHSVGPLVSPLVSLGLSLFTLHPLTS